MPAQLDASELASYYYASACVSTAREREAAINSLLDQPIDTDAGSLQVSLPYVHVQSLLRTIDRLSALVR